MKFVRHLTLVLLASAILGVAVTAASGRPDAGAAPTGRIAYSFRFWPEDERITDNYEIGVLDFRTGSDANLTRFPQCSEVDPAWSHSGSWLAFACQYGRHAGIGVMRVDRSERRRVIRSASWGQWTEPAWSPDDSKLAIKGIKSTPGIWVVNLDRSGRHRLTRGMDASPTWSPDGRAIAFDRTIRGARRIMTIGTNGKGRRTLARNACCPVWSPDGRSIAFLKRGLPRAVWLMGRDGRGKHPVPGVRRGLGIHDLAWSPDGHYLAYYVSCCRESGIYVTTFDGVSSEHLGYYPDGLGISWGP
jgi:TolB protein